MSDLYNKIRQTNEWQKRYLGIGGLVPTNVGSTGRGYEGQNFKPIKGEQHIGGFLDDYRAEKEKVRAQRFKILLVIVGVIVLVTVLGFLKKLTEIKHVQ